MRFLVGAACVAVIAFVGYYFWNEYMASQTHNRQNALAECDQLLASMDSVNINSLSEGDKFRIQQKIKECLKLIRG